MRLGNLAQREAVLAIANNCGAVNDERLATDVPAFKTRPAHAGPVSPVWGQIGHLLQTSALEPLWERLRAVKDLEASGPSDKPIQ